MSSDVTVNVTTASNIEIALTGGVGAGGNVFGPATSVADNLTSFYNTGGKIIKDSGISASSVSGHLAGTSNKHTGSVITNTPSGGVAATDVQSAINELDSDKLAKSSNLSDLTNTTTARSNLGLGNSATLDTGTTSGTVATGDHNHTGVYEPANANIQSHISSTLNPHSVTKTQVGLGNVTDNAQVKKISSSVDNTVMRWDGITGDAPQGSLATIDDSGSVNIPSGQSYKINNVALTYTDVGAAPTANGVTNGDSHDHSVGDGAQINHTTLSNIGTNTHAQIDSHITSTENPHSTTLAQAATAGASTTVDLTVGDIVNIGDGTTGVDKVIYANNGDVNKPALKYNEASNIWEYSNDGSSYSAIGSSDATSIRGTVVSSTEPTNGQQLVYNSTSDQYEPTTPAGGGDMLKATFDPTNVNGDAFDMDNMVEGTTSKILTADERVILGNTSGSNTGDETTDSIKTKLGAATSTADGYLTSTDWSTFNGKVSGTIGNSSGNIVSRPGDNTIGADTISEITSEAGVTVDGVLLKDNDVQADEVRTDNIVEKTSNNGVAIEGVTAKDSFLEVTEIAAPDSPAENKLRVYAKDNSGTTKLYTKDSSGTETELGAGGGGSTSDTSWTGSNWTSTTSSPSQRAIEEALNDSAIRYDDRASASGTADSGKLLMRYVGSGGIDGTVSLCVHFDESDAAWTDSSLSAHTLTNYSATYDASGKFDGCGVFAGAEKITSSVDSGYLFGTDDWSIETWFKTTTTTAEGIIISQRATDFTGAWSLRSSNFFWYDGSSTKNLYHSQTYADGNWHHIAAVKNGTTLTLYFDGVSRASATVSASLSFGSSTADVVIGYEGAANKYFTGSVDEIRISNGMARYTSGFTPATSSFSSAVLDNRLSSVKDSDINFGICQGRLTLESGVPVSTTDQTAKTTLYFTPYNGNKIATYNGTSWSVSSFTEKSLSLSGYTANKNYDIWIYNNAGTLTLDSTIWTDDTTRATALTTQDGIYVKNGDATRRYLGTIRTTATTGQCEDSGFGNTTGSRRFVWNMYNQDDCENLTYDTTNSWTSTGNGTWSILNSGNAAWKHEFVVGMSQKIKASILMTAYTNVSSYPIMAVGFNSSSVTNRTQTAISFNSATSPTTFTCAGKTIFAPGYNYTCALGTTAADGIATFLGDNGGDAMPNKIQSNFITESKR